jgi:tetratricopeptide (TPR) repeat protein
MPSAEIIPAKEDIKEQLTRMLASDRFRAARTQTPFLALVVKRALKGKQSPEEIIGPLLFPGFRKDEDTDVRVTASNLRNSLRKYYAGEGHEDLVIISLPKPPPDKSIKLLPGAAYTPRFDYNPRHAAAKEFKLGEYYLKRGLFADADPAIQHFYRVLQLAPNHVGAMLGTAEVLCDACALRRGSEEERREYLSVANDIVEKALRLAPTLWRVHVAKGYVLMLRNDLASAEAEFNVARSLDRISTESSFIFFQFLFKGGQSKGAVAIRKAYLDTHVDDVFAHAWYGVSLSGSGRLDEAEQVLKNALEMDKSCFVVHFGLAFLYSKQGRAAEATHHTECMGHLVDERSVEAMKRWLTRVQLAYSKTISP